MAGKVRYLHHKRGRYSARLVVPVDLRPYMEGKTELTKALGADRRQAIKHLPGAVAALQHQLAQAERKAASQGAAAVQPGRYPLSPDQIAASHYAQRLELDALLRNDSRYAVIGIDDGFAYRLREGVAGRLNDDALAELVGAPIERFRHQGNLTAERGSNEWRQIARALCIAEYEALARVMERDEGDFAGQPRNPMIANAAQPEDQPDPVDLEKLWADYVTARQQIGSMKDGGKRAAPVIDSLRKFLGHGDARRVTRKDVLAWRDHLIGERLLSPKTVSDIYLSTVRTLFAWAHENERLPSNPAEAVKQPKQKRQRTREKGYTNKEAIAVLKASRSYEPPADEFGRVRETESSVSAKRWVPILCAFTGARVSEITQLRKEDFRQEGDRWVIRITPEAGSVKAGDYRDVPLHRQVIAEGIVEHVESARQGPLFHNGTDPEKFAAKAQRMSNAIADWLRLNKIKPEGVQPSHAWRHRLKTQARDLGLDMRVVDAIQGHAGKTASDDYGDVSLIAKARVIDALPDYVLEDD